MSNITIGRYADTDMGQWSGWVEGVTDAGDSWITFLAADGRPVVHYPHREPSGAVIGDPIVLDTTEAA